MIEAKEMVELMDALNKNPFSLEYVIVGLMGDAFQNKRYSEWGDLDESVLEGLKNLGYKITKSGPPNDFDVRIEW